MSRLFYATALSKTSDAQGSLWSTVDATFARGPIRAVISLSAYSQQNSEQYQQFQTHFVYAYIITEKTPLMHLGPVTVPNPNKLRDNHVRLTTDHLSFTLQVENVAAAAMGMIYDTAPDNGPIDPLHTYEIATHDDAGSVIGTHQFVRFDGGRAIDPDEAGSQVLRRMGDGPARPTGFALLDRATLGDAPFRIDTSSGLAVPTGE